jgi:hypothetical protein
LRGRASSVSGIESGGSNLRPVNRLWRIRSWEPNASLRSKDWVQASKCWEGEFVQRDTRSNVLSGNKARAHSFLVIFQTSSYPLGVILSQTYCKEGA